MPHLVVVQAGISKEIPGTSHVHEGKGGPKGERSLTHAQVVELALRQFPQVLFVYEESDDLGTECYNLGPNVLSIATIRE